MAMSFTNISGTPNQYVDAVMPTGFGRFTINFWIRPTGIPGFASAVTMRGSSVVNRVAVGIDGATNRVFIDTASTSFNTYWETTDILIQGSWNMITAVVNNNFDRRIGLNSVMSFDTQEQSALTLSRILTGAYFDNNVTTPQWNGDIAELALWGVTLTQEEINALYTGAKAKIIRPGAMRYYIPMISNFNSERALVSSTINGTINASTHVRRIG